MNYYNNSEHWKKSKFNRYEASTHGRIRNAKTGKIISQHIAMNGYMRVGITGNDGNPIKAYVHDLVLETFCEKPSDDYECDHEDCDTKHNYIENLNWVTHKENMSDHCIFAKRLEDVVVRGVRTLFENGFSYNEVGKLTGIRQNTLYNIRAGKTYKGVI